MSQLTISSATRSFQVKVLAFSSPMYATMNGTQVKWMAVWFPIKLSHPEVQFDVVFRNEQEYETFQTWVRAQQLLASFATQLITLNWPQRNIYNWSGVITKFEAGGKRFNVAPRSRFSVLLVDSLVTRRALTASLGVNFLAIPGLGAPSGMLPPPSPQELSFIQNNSGMSFGVPTSSNFAPTSAAGVVTGSR